jgi:hypothetical protein
MAPHTSHSSVPPAASFMRAPSRGTCAHRHSPFHSRDRGAFQRVEQELKLASISVAERRKAAQELGKLASPRSYAPLLAALSREALSGLPEDRDVEAAILGALDRIGNAHSSSPTIKTGRAPLKEFVLAHLHDAGLVTAACAALRWTGTVSEISSDAREFIRAADAEGKPVSARAASTFDMQLAER